MKFSFFFIRIMRVVLFWFFVFFSQCKHIIDIILFLPNAKNLWLQKKNNFLKVSVHKQQQIFWSCFLSVLTSVWIRFSLSFDRWTSLYIDLVLLVKKISWAIINVSWWMPTYTVLHKKKEKEDDFSTFVDEKSLQFWFSKELLIFEKNCIFDFFCKNFYKWGAQIRKAW